MTILTITPGPKRIAPDRYIEIVGKATFSDIGRQDDLYSASENETTILNWNGDGTYSIVSGTTDDFSDRVFYKDGDTRKAMLLFDFLEMIDHG